MLSFFGRFFNKALRCLRMIARLKGKVIEKEERTFIIDVGGVGYRVMVMQTWHEAVDLGDEVTARIYHHVSDEAEALYGFSEQAHLDFFHLLLTVPSVGPKTAMNILQVASPDMLSQAV